MEKIIIAFTNYVKLLDVEHENSKLDDFFKSTKLGFPIADGKKPFIVIRDNGYNFEDEVPQSFGDIGAIICFDDINKQSEYTNKVKSLFDALVASKMLKVQVVHHTNQNKDILGLIKQSSNKFERIEGAHVKGNSKYLHIIDLLVNIEEHTNGNFAKIEKVSKKLGIDEILEAKLELLHSCLTPEDTNAVIWNVDRVTIEGTEIKNVKIGNIGNTEFHALSKESADPFSKEYIDALSALRDKLLQDY